MSISPSNYPCPACGVPVESHDIQCGGCGNKLSAGGLEPEDWVGRNIDGKYFIDSTLGVGGMGMVFRARRVLVGDEVALKILFPRFLESSLQRRLFRDEAVASARLSHPNVITVFDASISDGDAIAYIAMELLEGRSLKQLFREQAPMAPEALIPIAIEICTGLEAAHRARIIHRDLKPDNVLLERRPDGGERVKVMDFGIAAMLDVEREWVDQHILGTVRYMAPEQCRREPIDGRTDIYSLGIVMYEALTRRRATKKSITAVLEDEILPPNRLLPVGRRLPAPLEGLLMRMVAKSPDDRPQDVRTVRNELASCYEALTGERPVGLLDEGRPSLSGRFPMGTAGAGPPPSTKTRRVALWVGLACAGFVGIVGGFIWRMLGS